MKQTDQAVRPTTQTPITHLVETIQETLPVAPEAARQAGAMVATGAIRRLPNLLGGQDQWAAADGPAQAIASIRGGSCTCQEAITAAHHAGGPLCRHRLAAMIAVRIFGGEAPSPGDLIHNLIQTQILAGQPLYLKIQRIYSRSVNDADTIAVIGWRPAEGQPWHDAKIWPDGLDGTFYAAIELAGWAVMERKRGQGTLEQWRLGPIAAPTAAWAQKFPKTDNPFTDDGQPEPIAWDFSYYAQARAGDVEQEIDRDALIRHVGQDHATLLERRAEEHGQAKEYTPSNVVLIIRRKDPSA